MIKKIRIFFIKYTIRLVCRIDARILREIPTDDILKIMDEECYNSKNIMEFIDHNFQVLALHSKWSCKDRHDELGVRVKNGYVVLKTEMS